MKGSPGAILAIAIGAIFLSLGWNGRYAAVWEALRTGEASVIGGSGSSGGGGGTGAIIPDTDMPIIGGSDRPATPPNTEPIAGRIPNSQLVCGTNDYAVADSEGGSKQTWRCYKPNDVQMATNVDIANGFKCRDGWRKGWVYNGENQKMLPVCVRGNGTSPARIGGGQVVDDYAANLLPNGTMAVRYQPNEIGLFDA